MTLDKLLGLLFSALILMQAYLVRRRVGTWLFPACLFGLFWFGFTFFPLVFLLAVPSQPLAVGYILLCSLAFSLGSLVFDWRSAFARNAEKPLDVNVYASSFLRVALYVSAALATVFLVLNLAAQGISVQQLVSDLPGTAAAYAGALYAEALNDNLWDRLSTVSAYVTPVLGGLQVSAARTPRSRRIVILLSLLPSILILLTQTSKGLLFLSIAFYYGGVLAARLAQGRLRILEPGGGRRLALACAAILPFVTVAFLFRSLGDVDDEGMILSRLRWYYASYAFGHLYAFSDWFSYSIGGHSLLAYTRENITYGFYTFMALFQMLGSKRVVPLGVYDDYYTNGDLMTTNIYTMFRGLIVDYGFIGGVVFMVIAGVLVHWSFRSLLVQRRPILHVAVFAMLVGFIYHSYILSILCWTRIYVGFALIWAVLRVNAWVVGRRTTAVRT